MRDINVLNCIYLSIKDYGRLKPEAILYRTGRDAYNAQRLRKPGRGESGKRAHAARRTRLAGAFVVVYGAPRGDTRAFVVSCPGLTMTQLYCTHGCANKTICNMISHLISTEPKFAPMNRYTSTLGGFKSK